jgi:SynChlorMet cassette protein ScmD
MKHSDTPIANPIIVLREESDNWALLFNPDSYNVLVINPVGVTVWKMLDGKNQYDDILGNFRDHFSEVPERALDDVKAFVMELEKHGFVGFVMEN